MAAVATLDFVKRNQFLYYLTMQTLLNLVRMLPLRFKTHLLKVDKLTVTEIHYGVCHLGFPKTIAIALLYLTDHQIW